MNYNKLLISFFLLFLMTVIHLFLSLFILHSLLLVVCSIIAMILCIIGLIYVSKHSSK